MGNVVFSVEPESRSGDRWCIWHGGNARARYRSRAQAIIDARQLAAFQSELHGRTALVRVLDVDGELVENFVCDGIQHPHLWDRRAERTLCAAALARPGNAEAGREIVSRFGRVMQSGHN